MWILELKGLTLKWPLGVDSNYFYTGRLHPKVKTLSLSYTIFDRKGIPFLYIYTFARKWYPFHIPVPLPNFLHEEPFQSIVW